VVGGFGLTAQLRRAAVSVPANFVEGFAQTSGSEKARFYEIAQSSAAECRYFLMLAHDLRYADTAPLQIELDRICAQPRSYAQATVAGRGASR
jgi:four helix bundle protein